MATVNDVTLNKILKAALRRHHVPGATLTVLDGNRVTEAAAGVLNVDTGVPATTDSLFQIGSITKIFTTSLVMQLVDEAKVSLDQPVRELRPWFAVADRTATKSITLRHLMTHTSGVEGDLFLDTGSGDDATEKLLRAARFAPQLYPAGERMSYCNLGFALLGHVVHAMTGKSWDTAMRQRLFKPLGMTHALTRPEDTLRFRCAIGHVADPAQPTVMRLSPMPWLSLGQRAAGATPMMRGADLMRFVRMHLDGGISQTGERLLSRRSVRAMQSRQVRLSPDAPRGMSHWGLGWFLGDWDGGRVFGHDGGTVGQYAFLRIHAPSRTAVALLTNGGDAGALADDVFETTFEPMAGVHQPALPAADPALRIAPDTVTGTYARLGGRTTVTHDGARFWLEQTVLDPSLGFGPIPHTEIRFARRHLARFVTENAPLARNQVNFEGDAQGRFAFLGLGNRLSPRVA
ncbi:MAG: serine hydrolase domain-containing protein [Pseudomonadales bacterium]